MELGRGTVVCFGTRNFGFVVDAAHQEYFFHAANVCGEKPKVGDEVEFYVAPGRQGRGPVAVRVKLVNAFVEVGA
jgi:cold shock CspA family protein